jgi:hypothetical protein
MRGTVVVTSWTDARISWPRCKRQGKSHPSLLLDDELACAVRTESAAAVAYWWRGSPTVVKAWRKLLEVTRTNNPGTRRLMKASAQAGADSLKAKEWTDAECDAKSGLARRLNLGQYLKPGYHGPRWTAKEKRLLGKLPDDEVARRIGRTVGAVRVKRVELGLPNPETQAWTVEEIALLGTASDGKIARQIGCTRSAVSAQRWILGIPPPRAKGRAR